MSFREGMLQARGQIVFIAALVCSTAAIVYLEYLDTTGRMRDEVVAAAATTGEATPSWSAEWQSAAQSAISQGQGAYAADPANSIARVAALNAAVIGLAHGIGSAAEHRQAIEKVLTSLETDGSKADEALAPALALVAAASPQYKTRIMALLSWH